MGEINKVSVVKCGSYKQEKVDKAVAKALELIDFKFKKGMKVLIKPNVVGSFPKKQIATTTNPALVEAVCKILKRNNCKIFIGDSPFTNAECSFKDSGIEKVAKKYGKLIIFEQDKLIKIKDKKAKILKEFQIAKTIKDVNLVIDIPKLKTHMLTKYTGAIKNLYGCIPGGLKQRIHLKGKGDENFSKILIDIYQNIKPGLTIMDGVISMEGNGPTSGDKKNTKIILASPSAVALDIAAAKIIGLQPHQIHAIKEAIARKLYPNYDFELAGMKVLPKFKFKIPHTARKTQKLLNNLGKEKPIVCDTKKCIKCRMCEKHCPTKSIHLAPYPIVNPKTCIRCFCCIEICPQDAMGVGK